MQVVIVSAERYEFKGRTGDQVKGTKLRYVSGESQADGRHKGWDILEVNTTDLGLYDQVSAAPGVYDVEFRQVPGPYGRPSLVISSVVLVDVFTGELPPSMVGNHSGR